MNKDVPYIVYESSEAKHERIEKRLIIALVLSIVMMFVSNGLWLWHESQYEYADETVELNADSGNANYIGNNGDITNGENKGTQKTQAKITFLQSLFYIYFQLQDEAWGMNRVKEYRPAAIEAARGFFKRHEALYECGSTERLNFFNECRKQHSTPIMESQTFNQFMEEICK